MAEPAEPHGTRPVEDPHTRQQWERSGENWDWIVQHPELLEPYRGEYVVIWDQQIVAHGKDPRALRAHLQEGPYASEPFLAFRVPTREETDSVLAL